MLTTPYIKYNFISPRLVFVFLSLFTLSSLALAQSPTVPNFNVNVQQWSRADGLPTWNIYSYLEDVNGQLWLDADIGLISFDGYDFEVRYEKKIGGAILSSIVEDTEQGIWFEEFNGTNTDLMYFDWTTDEAFCFDALVDADSSTTFSAFEIGEQVLIYDNGGNYYNKQGQLLFSLPFSASDRNHYSYAAPNNRIWVLEERMDLTYSNYIPNPQYYVHLFNRDGTLVYSDSSLVRSDKENQFWTSEEGHLHFISQTLSRLEDSFTVIDSYLYTDAGKTTFSIASFERSPSIPIKSSTHKHSLPINKILLSNGNITMRFRQDTFYFFYQGEMIHLSEENPYFIDNGLSANSTFIDKSGAFWFSNRDGLTRITIEPQIFEKYLHAPEEHSTRGMTIDGKNQLFVNSYSGLKVIDLEKKKEVDIGFYYEEDARPTKFADGLFAYYNDDDVWFGRHNSFSIEQLKGNQIIRYHFEEGFRDMYTMLSVNDQLWIGTVIGLYSFDKETEEVNVLHKANLAISSFHQNEEGIWAATDKGLVLFDLDGQIKDHYLEQFENDFPLQIRHLHEDADGTFWLATTQGLVHWDRQNDKVLHHYTTREGLSNNGVHCVYEVGDDFLWLSSNYGLMRLHKPTGDIKTYLDKDGIADNEFNFLSHYRASDGQLFFGGIKGVTAFYPEQLIQQENSKILRAHIVSGEITNGTTGEVIPLSFEARQLQKIHLSTRQNFVTLILSPYLLDKDANLEYRWQLGTQNKIIQDDRTIRINNLAYGKQQLKIKVRRIGYNWSDEVLTIDLYRAKPYFLKWWFWGIVVGVLALLIWQYIRYQTNKLRKDTTKLTQLVNLRTAEIEADKLTIEQQADDLKRLNETQKRFFSNITHEFRTPLTLIGDPLQQVIEDVTDEKIKHKLLVIQKNADQLHELIDELLAFDKLENGKLKLVFNKADIISFTEHLVKNASMAAHQKNQQLSFYTNTSEWTVYFDESTWRKIVNNLLLNAIKFTPTAEEIKVDLIGKQKEEGCFIQLLVQDTGLGIKQSETSYIFDRFEQAQHHNQSFSTGTGIGLSLVKELVELQDGTIKVYSKEGVGTTFEVILPVKTTSSLMIAPSFEFPNFYTKTQENTVTAQNNLLPSKMVEKLTILIVEDNLDLRNYVKECLMRMDKTFHFLEATNGAEGIAVATATIPDLIISDIMMPVKDGYELVTTLRSQEVTSHIPVVLLTARTSEESRLEGFERGADAFLSKPFSPKELLARIGQLIRLRQLLQQRYAKGLESTEEIDVLFRSEDAFVQKVQQLILDHIEDTNLDGAWLAQQCFLSKSHLYRKIKSLTNQSANQFINTIRVMEAQRLLRNTDQSIAQIALSVGFKTAVQFSKVFKKKVGVSASQYKRES